MPQSDSCLGDGMEIRFENKNKRKKLSKNYTSTFPFSGSRVAQGFLYVSLTPLIHVLHCSHAVLRTALLSAFRPRSVKAGSTSTREPASWCNVHCFHSSTCLWPVLSKQPRVGHRSGASRCIPGRGDKVQYVQCCPSFLLRRR